jgi:uncharacterized membrane protein
MIAARILQVLLWLAYPALIFCGLQILEPRHLALLLAILLLLRRRQLASHLLADLTRTDFMILVAMLVLSGLTAATNSEQLLRLYPVAVNLGLLLLFGLSLRHPPSMVERFARLRQADLPLVAVRYTRRVTQVWCAFFVVNGLLATYTAVWTSRETWALYNGLIAYLLMGSLFAGEWLLRRRLTAGNC